MKRGLLLLLAGLLLWSTRTGGQQSGPALPATCTTGEVFTYTTTTPDLQAICAAMNTWVVSPFGLPGGTGSVLRSDGTWGPLPTGEPGGAATWGTITGTLGLQLDLQTALDGKEPANANLQAHVAAAHAPATAQKNADITKAEIEAKLTGEVSSHTHAAGSGTAWGGITGTLATQADLQNALNGKAGTAHSHTDGEVANNITVDLATLATTANAGDSATGFFPAGALEVARGGHGAAPGADDQLFVADSTSAGTWRAVPDCDTALTSKLLYDTTTNTFSCGVDQAAGGGPVTLVSTTPQADAVIATYTAITGLSFTPAAATRYLMDCFIRYTSTAATTGINFAWDVPASVTSIHMSGYTTTTAVGAGNGFSQRADNVGTPTSAAVITVENVAILNAQLVNGANATLTSLGFTPETANSVSVIPGSVCQVRSY